MLGALLFSVLLSLCTFACASPAAVTNDTRLAVALFEDGAWQACRVECARVLLHTGQQDLARLLQLICGLRLGAKSGAELEEMSRSASVSHAIRAMAGYELGQHLWQQGELAAAFSCFERVFLGASNRDLFLRSGCSLQILSRRHPDEINSSSGLQAQLDLCRDLWTDELYRQCDPESVPQRTGWMARPGQWAIAFYRAQIGPAIGSRCSLHPSCSEYGRQALLKHGLLGFSMIADRGFREPAVVAEQRAPVLVNRRRFYHDPVEQHDYWMEK